MRKCKRGGEFGQSTLYAHYKYHKKTLLYNYYTLVLYIYNYI
jgi:hypothetical protein